VDLSLDNLASRLGVGLTGRHSALGDARITAEIFHALVPRLRSRGIRTLAEALAASRTLAEQPDNPHPPGWSEPAPARAAAEPLRVDPYPYRHRVAEIMSAPPRTIARDAALGEALRAMTDAQVSSVLVRPQGDGPLIAEGTGIVTERDVMRALARHGAQAFTMAVAEVMSSPLVTVAADAFAYVAIGRMNRLRIRHLGVAAASGEVVGVLSARDLLRLRSGSSLELGDEIEQAADVHELGVAWGRLAQVARGLSGEGLPGREVAAVISQQLCDTTRRAVALAQEAMLSAGFGDPPCPYAFVVLGSAGRGESLLAMDQDNALIFADGEPQERDGWFAELGRRVSDALHEAGVPYCTGGVMASNPPWRGSVSAWGARIDDWIGRSRPKDLMAVDIFFDLHPVAGDAAMAHAIRQRAFDAAKGEAGFAKLLLESAGPAAPGRTWFGGFRTENGRINLKRSGLFPLVSAVRALAICHGVTARSTARRLADIRALGLGMESDLEALTEAQAVFLDLILRQQLADIETGRPPGNSVEVKRLTRRDRARLHEALAAVEHVDEMARDLLFAR
jgi:DNA polymerase-3 subunit epsilon/CBS domain-containing protein